jgi:D-alanyl-lipoteichoic acid acyltransferase DltB (MBOAT superfamily)
MGLMVWGLFKKVVIADNIAGLVNLAYGDPENKTGLTLLLASYLFAVQIYCDFSGYSDMAIGAARVMGYDLMENFRTPYIAKSIKEFWSRWHISLSTWFRDYLYIPLGGNRVSKSRWMFNLFFVFLVSGIWHGANWTYIIWGALHGLFLVLAILKDEYIEKNNLTSLSGNKLWLNILNVFITFHLATFAWIFFRAETVTDAFVIIQRITDLQISPTAFREAINFFAVDPKNFGRIIYLFALLSAFLYIDPKMDQIVKGRITIARPAMRYALYATIAACILLLGFFGEVSFIYFQF